LSTLLTDLDTVKQYLTAARDAVAKETATVKA